MIHILCYHNIIKPDIYRNHADTIRLEYDYDILYDHEKFNQIHFVWEILKGIRLT